MNRNEYDLILVGGGFGGSSLAAAMAARGARVLVIEREEVFKDRVRGEGMTPWGVAEAQALGIYEGMRDACGLEIRYWDAQIGPMQSRRDLLETTPQRTPVLDFLHPEMQETLIHAAAAAGAEVWRGASARAVSPGAGAGRRARVTVERGDETEQVSARLVVGVDGRGSRVRTWVGFSTREDPKRLLIGGVLLEGASAPRDAISLRQSFGRTAIFFPQRRDLMRAYAVYNKDLQRERLQGPGDLPRFIEAAVAAGTPPAWLEGARMVGPLATFEGADVWVDHPYRDGVALIGDAAAATDPSWGQGLSLTMRDVRTLRDALLATEDWDAAGRAYAEEHDRYYETLHAVEDWYTKLFLEVGPAADARRQRALPLLMEDPTRAPDALISGPNQPVGEEDRIRFLGE